MIALVSLFHTDSWISFVRPRRNPSVASDSIVEQNAGTYVTHDAAVTILQWCRCIVSVLTLCAFTHVTLSFTMNITSKTTENLYLQFERYLLILIRKLSNLIYDIGLVVSFLAMND